MISQRTENGIILLTLENDLLRVELAPALGGRFTSVYNKSLNKEFLWHNQSLPLEKAEPGADYDSNFWGGIDELLPNDLPEKIDGIDYPDHGELWTTALDHVVEAENVILSGTLPKSRLFYQKTVILEKNLPEVKTNYTIRNLSGGTRHFLWKLHAALQITVGDRLKTSAKNARVVDPGSSRFRATGEFGWPEIEGMNAAIVPPKDGTMDFFYLYNAPEGTMKMISAHDDHCFAYRYDQEVFPFQWYFASYGQFRGHYTAILEPASAMPVSVNEAAGLGQCSVLEPGEEMNTSVTIYAGVRNEV
ncbi:MAG: hypothetical protein M9933_11855 [Chitinophagaceae bacterium]|nr:hypothetical protein [Chitinophagaceae bacterium]